MSECRMGLWCGNVEAVGQVHTTQMLLDNFSFYIDFISKSFGTGMAFSASISLKRQTSCWRRIFVSSTWATSANDS